MYYKIKKKIIFKCISCVRSVDAFGEDIARCAAFKMPANMQSGMHYAFSYGTLLNADATPFAKFSDRISLERTQHMFIPPTKETSFMPINNTKVITIPIKRAVYSCVDSNIPYT